jgi:Mitochondrial ribosomal protein (VAR1)
MFDLLSKEYEIKKYSIIRYKCLPNSYKKLLSKLDLSFINFKQKIRRKILEKLHLYFYYRQLIYINKSKFNYNYLQQLKKYLQTIYNKDIEFNLINLKRFYLNSDILSESLKLKLTKDRRRIFRYLTKLRNKVKVKEKHSFIPINLIQGDIIKDIKYKNVTGFRLEAKGRLTKRHTASRSITKVKYKGNLLNMDSSHKGLSTILLKGNLESNLQYTKLKSKTRIGSFGIKG